MSKRDTSGWAWFSEAEVLQPDDSKSCFQDCFKTAAGKAVLLHLRQHFIERRLAPTASADELRHLEGGRCAIAYIERLASDPVQGQK